MTLSDTENDDLGRPGPERGDALLVESGEIDTTRSEAGVSEVGVEGGFARFWRRMRRQKLAMVALGYIVLLYAIALLAPVLATHDPRVQDLTATLQGPSTEHWLGTDENGRDVFSRLLFAGRVSLLAGFQAVALALAVGVIPGLLAGYLGGKVDLVISRITDAFMAMPNLIIAVAIVGVLGPSLTNAMIAIGILFSPSFIRLTRGTVLVIREEEFIAASRTIGTPTWRIILRHILPNIRSVLIVQASLAIGLAMLAEAALSFLGLGAQPPIGSWGSMVSSAFRQIYSHPQLLLWPSIMIASSVMAYSMLGEGLREALGREHRGRR